MNFQKALEELLKYLGEYPEFEFHELFLKEISNLLKKELKGQEKDFFKQMLTQFDNIKQFRKEIITVGDNELLSHIGDELSLYSIHIKKGSKFNVRLLMFFNNDNPTFLCAFYEKSGKRQTGYEKFIKIAKKRYNELRGEW